MSMWILYKGFFVVNYFIEYAASYRLFRNRRYNRLEHVQSLPAVVGRGKPTTRRAVYVLFISGVWTFRPNAKARYHTFLKKNVFQRQGDSHRLKGPASRNFREWTWHSVVKDSVVSRPRSGSKCVVDIATRRCVVGQRATTTRPSVNA